MIVFNLRILILIAVSASVSWAIDLDGNGMSDVWEQKFNAVGIPPGDDPDGDNATNHEESLAGTDPFNPNEHPRVAWISTAGTNATVAIACEPGKYYELQRSPALGSGWLAEGSFLASAGGEWGLTVSALPASAFFRVAVSDVDTDGDGLSDWEERQAGLSPNSPASNGQLDANGTPVNDRDYVAGLLANPNVISLAADDTLGFQPDAGSTSDNPGRILALRTGLGLNSVEVLVAPDLAQPGAGVENVDFAALPRSIRFAPGAKTAAVAVVPLHNPNRSAPVLATLQLLPGPGYSTGVVSRASVLIQPTATPGGSGLTGHYFTNASATYSSSANFNPANLKLTRVDPTIDFVWGTTTNPIPNNGYYTVRWTGRVQPQYSETYYFVANTDDGVRLWVNDQLIINSWVTRGATDSIGKIELVAGASYNLKLEYFQATGSASARLSWYSASQPKQVIPSKRLYPDPAPAPAFVTSPGEAVAFVGQPFSFQVTAANSPGSITASNLPPGLVFDSANAQLSGTPLVAGPFQVLLTASNAAGAAASILNLQVLETGASLSRDLWLGVPGTNIADIPLDSPPSSTAAFGALQGITGFGDNYGERIRGYLTAPVTGNYYFWLGGSDAAELWIANDSEPANKVLRARVRAGTAPLEWTREPEQRSAWLALEAGSRYYLEVLHKAGVGPGDHWEVGWRCDASGTNTLPLELVPSFVLSRHFPTPSVYLPDTLYTATLVPQAGAVSSGLGSATLRVNAEKTEAVLKFSSSGLSSTITGQHIHSDAYLQHAGQILFDIDDAAEQPDGSRVWRLEPVGTLSRDDVLEILAQNRAYINLHTANYPAGEIKGYFTLATGTREFSPPPPAPTWTDDHSSSNAAARFLIQASFGPNLTEIAAVQASGYENWLSNQFSLPPTYHLPYVLANASYDLTTPYPGSRAFNAWWKTSTTAPDQLRQRVAFALSEIMVVSEKGVLTDRATALSDYYDMLLDHAFGNFRELIEAVTLHPAMGNYLDMRGNQKGDIVTGRHPNENYAREILQLFSVGLYRMWPDGTLVLNSADNVVPTYGQEEIIGFANVFTGWNYYQALQANGRLPTSFTPPSNHTNAMVLVPSRHELGAKRVLDNSVLPPAAGLQANPANVEFDAYGLNDLELALDSIFKNQNVGPYICRQLIQRLVTSHPTRDYVCRVVQVFNDNGAGVRGDLKAVIRAILLDYEARSGAASSQPTFGKLREPLLRATAAARAFPAPAPVPGVYSQSGDRAIACSTAVPHRLGSGDTVLLSFADTSGQPAPAGARYPVSVSGPTSFTVNDPALAAGSYVQTPNATITNSLTGERVTTNVIFVTLSGHGLAPGMPVFIYFSSGGALAGEYLTVSATNSSNFAVFANETASRAGSCRIYKLTGAYAQSGTTITISINGNHGLAPGAPVYVNFTSGSAADGRYTVGTVLNDSRFTVTDTNSVSRNGNSLIAYPLAPPVLARSGTFTMAYGTWNVGSTDGSLGQTPLRSPTVFNFFFPDYKFPGVLAAAGLTTPEFQLVSDTETATQMNFLAAGVLGNSANTNGLSSFTSGDGDIVMDLGPWMTAGFTANATALGTLFDALNSLLAAGQLSPEAKSVIVKYAATLPYGTPPSYTQMRDRVRAVAHLILVSPDFTTQR